MHPLVKQITGLRESLENLSKRVRRLEVAPSGGGGAPAPTLLHCAVFVVSGEILPGTGNTRLYNTFGVDLTITKVHLSAGEAPTGANLIVDINMNAGGTIFAAPADRPIIVDGSNSGSTTVIGTATWANGSYVMMDIDQVGSTARGYNLVVSILTEEV